MAWCTPSTRTSCLSSPSLSHVLLTLCSPKEGNTFEDYKVLAAKAQIPSLSPPGGLPTGGIRKTTVDVGLNGTLTYYPNNIVEPPNTVVEFKFNPRNHTVTESSFDKPCQPIKDGISSGFIATTQVPAVASFEVVVKDTKPLWFYCGQVNGNHCQSGMVGAINAPAVGNNTVDAFIAKAKLAPPPSVIPPKAPLGGRVFVKDLEILQFNLNGGNAIDVDAILAGNFTIVSSAKPTSTKASETSTQAYTYETKSAETKPAETTTYQTKTYETPSVETKVNGTKTYYSVPYYTKAWESKTWETQYRPTSSSTSSSYSYKPTETKSWGYEPVKGDSCY